MSEPKPRFNAAVYFQALEATVQARGLRWKDVSTQTGISASTLSRMAQGKGPDSGSLATLAAWSALNPADYVQLENRSHEPEPLARMTTLLRHDPRLTADAADMLDKLMRSAYERLANRDNNAASDEA
jgi:transcriptional regulator with XRE-family HTH domain